MNFRRLTTCEDGLYAKAMELYKKSFPLHEQRLPACQTSVIKNNAYQFNLIYDQSTWVGILLCWETSGFIYVEHFCILPEMRNKKYGQKALELLGQRGKRMILEIDPPVDEVSIHRKSFYERAGYVANRFEHIHPPYHQTFKGHHLVIMSYPDALPAGEYDAFNQYLSDVVMAE